MFYIQAPLRMLEDYNLELVIGGDTSSTNTISLNVLKENGGNQENQPKVLFVRTEEGGDVKLYFQAIRRGAVIKKGFVLLGNKPCIENGAVILIREQIDAYWSRKDEKLYFKNIEDLERILPHFFEKKVQDLRQELRSIKNSDYQYLYLDLDLDKIQPTLPKTKLARIDFLLQKGNLEIFRKNGDPGKRNAYLKYAQKYRPQILKDHKLVICKVADLDSLYHIVCEAYYTTEIGGEQRVAAVFEKNSTRD
ncbi:hypothetical protein NHP21005_17830 [Helicobacter sp. NHP21005]|uniref:hypothetical protein n=1 Tax=Helicobacter felistomachi TaxID=3040201 RepID=UPI002572CC45|nr:hypothetical protein [Helicobacter sp. NHP21005]BEG58095.1 hypothetical protein NHP21005_17830 [Helicobacter sp. NHP21005]